MTFSNPITVGLRDRMNLNLSCRTFSLCLIRLTLISGIILGLSDVSGASEDDAGTRVWVPGSANHMVIVSNDGLALDSLGENGWKSIPAKVPEYILLTSASRSGMHNADWLDDLPDGTTPFVMAPASAQSVMTNPSGYWEERWNRHFHDYACQSTDYPTRPVPVTHWGVDGNKIPIKGHSAEIHVIKTPGPTAESVSYLIEHSGSGQSWLFSGDLVLGDGRIPDLYRFQDTIPEAGLRGYHGYAGRLASLLGSLRKLTDLKFDRHFSGRDELEVNMSDGPLAGLESRVISLYENYLSSSALHWYFGDRFLNGSFERLSTGQSVPPGPNFTRFEDRPAWVLSKGTTRIIQSRSGKGFMLDCGNQGVIRYVDQMYSDGSLSGIDGIFVTHYHDDHTDSVDEASKHFDCDVYAIREYADLLKHPSAYRLPCLTGNPITRLKAVRDGYQMEWEEFVLTFHFFPGQTWYHGGLLVHLKDDPKQAVFFAGDAFTPSGLDDYCIWNRNLLNEGTVSSDSAGYFQCLDLLLGYNRQIPGYPGLPLLVANQHVDPVFEIRPDKSMELVDKLRRRVGILGDLVEPDTPSLGLDPYWFTLYPYQLSAKAGERVAIDARVNPADLRSGGSNIPGNAVVVLSLHLPEAWGSERGIVTTTTTVAGLSSQIFDVGIPKSLTAGLYPVSASLRIHDAEDENIVYKYSPHATECLIRVGE